MFTQTLDRLGNWNPQLLREWNGRLKPVHITLAIGLSVLIQISIVFLLGLMLPPSIHTDNLELSTAPKVFFRTDTPSTTLSHSLHQPNSPILVISSIEQTQPILGTIPPESVARSQQIKVNDRILKINGELAPDFSLSMPKDADILLENWANSKVSQHSNNLTKAQIAGKAPLGNPLVLELENAQGDRYTVSLPIVATTYENNPFCVPWSKGSNDCLVRDDRKGYQVNWALWCFVIFCILTGGIGLALVGIGSFMVCSDLEQEQQRGTLNFVRLTPRSPWSIILGKILGVPTPLYISILIAFPLHFLMGLVAGFSTIGLLAFYFTLTVQVFVLYSGLSLLTLVNFRIVNFQAWVYTVLGLGLAGGTSLIGLMYNLGNSKTEGYPSFVFLWGELFSPVMPFLYALKASPVLSTFKINLFVQFYMAGQSINLVGYLVAMLIMSGLFLSFIYIAIDRKFQNPGTTWIPRRYSYLLTLVIMVSFLIFAVPNEAISRNWDGKDWTLVNSILIIVLSSVYLLVLTCALYPNRQLLLDWTRFGYKSLAAARGINLTVNTGESPILEKVLPKNFSSHFIHDRSTPLPPLILNLLIILGLFSLWLLSSFQGFNITLSPLASFGVFAGIIAFAGLVILLWLVSQVLLLTPLKKSNLWISWSALGTIAAHPIFMSLTYGYFRSPEHRLLWEPEVWMMLSTLLLQALGILSLGWVHRRQLDQAAQSEWQELLAPQR